MLIGPTFLFPASHYCTPGDADCAKPGLGPAVPGHYGRRERSASISTPSANSAASDSGAETSCRPRGNPGTGMGMEMAGKPRAVQGRLRIGSPVDARPAGAGPGAEGV